MRLSAHTLLLPTRGQLEARMMVTAFELNLDNITDDAVSSMIYAVEVCRSCPHRNVKSSPPIITRLNCTIVNMKKEVQTPPPFTEREDNGFALLWKQVAIMYCYLVDFTYKVVLITRSCNLAERVRQNVLRTLFRRFVLEIRTNCILFSKQKINFCWPWSFNDH